MPSNTPAQPRDKQGAPVPVLAPDGTPASDALDATSQALALPTKDSEPYKVVELACTGDCFIAFGASGGSVTTSGQLFVAGVAQYRVPDGATHLHHLQASGTDNAKPITVTGLI